MPLAIRAAKAGTVTLLKRLPTLTISATISSSVLVCDLRTGTRISPIKIEPPTHIEAHIKWTHVMRPSATAIIIFTFSQYIIDAAAFLTLTTLSRFLNIIKYSAKQEIY